MDWSKLDPNVVISIGSVVGAAATWLYHKAKGEKTASANDILESLVTQVINAPDVNLENVKQRIDSAARAALAKVGVRGAIAERLVHEFVEYGSAELHKRFDLWTKSMMKLDNAAQATAKVLESTPTPV